MSNEIPSFMEQRQAFMEQQRNIKAKELAKKQALKKKKAKKKKKTIKAMAIISLVALTAVGGYVAADKIVSEFQSVEQVTEVALPTDLEENAAEIYQDFEQNKVENTSKNIETLVTLIKDKGFDSYEGLDNIQVVNKYFDILNIGNGSIDQRIEMFEKLGATLSEERTIAR